MKEKVDQIRLVSRIYEEVIRVPCWLENDTSPLIEQYLEWRLRLECLYSWERAPLENSRNLLWQAIFLGYFKDKSEYAGDTTAKQALFIKQIFDGELDFPSLSHVLLW